MTKQLRKRHVQAWAVLAMLLPAGIISAWFVRPPVNTGDLRAAHTANVFPVVVDSIVTQKYTARIRCTQNYQRCQLEYIHHLPLQLPSALLYRMKPGASTIDEHEILGRIGGTGNYYFAMEQRQEAFILYDFIHHNIIDTIKF